MPVFDVDQLKSIGKCIFQAVGSVPKEAEIVARLLANANLVGHDSHGVIRIPQYLGLIETGHIVLNNEIEILRQTKSSAVINGNWGFGQVIASKAMNIAIEKAQSTSVSTVTVRSCNHVGRLADYAQIAANHNLIAMLTVNNHGSGTRVAPRGGSEGRLSTHPICFAIPRTEMKRCRKDGSLMPTESLPMIPMTSTNHLWERSYLLEVKLVIKDSL